MRYLTLFTLSLGLLWSTSSFAADTVLAPPASSHQSASSASSTDLESPQNESSLQKELAPPKQSDDVEVHSYLRKDDQAKITEYASHGHVYLIKVQPMGNFPPYYLEDDNGDGVFSKRIAGGYERVNPPMWVIKRF